ncbi:glucan endo-1,3-beta-glucosidase 1-like [Asparagus officinalis]|uniref:glucan endo-1,3-beta-glucosidase 1-like n=1 Tax=Asparagus officinalis TaxID=4686 RepID=UPI00098E6B92|nr:glucan endo-1,3-beta-glucosidase 1-like [Asparagus officinalis]
MEGRTAGSCYFQGAAMVTTTDPSHGGCVFPGSKETSNATRGGGTNASEISKADGARVWRRPRARIQQRSLCVLHVLLSVMTAVAVSICSPWA